MRARVAFRFTWMLFAAAVALAPATAAAASPHIEQADLTGDINNIMSSYMQNAVGRAEADHADALLVVMNTPGGISNSMDDIVTSLLNCKVPVVVFVYPSGARAASAGLFVAQAADVLAMAPGTNIGSAHPIQATGENLSGDLGAKVLNDAVTRVRNLAIVSLANLPVNIAGALLMLLALILFIADLKAPTHGFLSVGGVFALLLGMAFLINTGPIGLGVNPIVSIAVAAITLGFFAFFIRKVLAARRQPAFVGGDSIVGAVGEARE